MLSRRNQSPCELRDRGDHLRQLAPAGIDGVIGTGIQLVPCCEQRAQLFERVRVLGHRTLIAGYYDLKPERARDWIEAARKSKGTIGIMYTSWYDKFEDLETFASHAGFNR